MADPMTDMRFSGTGVKREVEWHLEDIGVTVSLAEIIKVAEREFPGIPFSDLTISGYGNFSDDSGDYSDIQLRHKSNR